MRLRWNDKNHKRNYIPTGELTNLFFAVLLLIVSCSLYADDNHQQVLNLLPDIESAFHKISSDFYAEPANDSVTSAKNIKDSELLYEKLQNLLDNDRQIEAIQLIHNNITTITDNLDHPQIFTVLELLLQHNDLNLAENLSEIIMREGDDFQFATTNFIFARYHAERHEWQAVLKQLENSMSDLSERHSEYALLLQGSALQNLKSQGQAASVLQKIPAESEYYRYAQLNFAISQIRQDWLSSAQITINNLIRHSKVSDDELTNRLRVVLGYALLRKNYFRDARKVFRKISQHSQYVNRALLGIALCAINQDDLESALNSLSLLQSKNTMDLPVDESYLLGSYVYEKLGQSSNVLTHATLAMDYYQTRITNLQAIDVKNIDFSALAINLQHPVFKLNNIPLNYADLYPLSFLQNYQQLLTFKRLNKSDTLATAIEKLIIHFKSTLQLMIKNLIDQKIAYLDSYLNQVRYGLARLYDNSGRDQ